MNQRCFAGRKINDDRAEWLSLQIINEIDKKNSKRIKSTYCRI